MELKGSKTFANLEYAFAGESQARNKYTYFASKARKEGYEQIAKFFEETAENEKEHAKIWFKLLNGGEISPTVENLLHAAEGEHEEWVNMYAGFATIARQEGFNQIATLFELVAKIEKTHEERYLTLLDNIKTGKVFQRSPKVVWVCSNCGHHVVSEKAPDLCAVCNHAKAFFEIEQDNY